MRSSLIVIAGIQGSGKSTLADHIVENGLKSNFLNVEKGKAIHIDIDKYFSKEVYRLDRESYYKNIAVELAERIPKNESVVITTTPIGIKPLIDGIKGSYNIDLDGKIKMLFIPCELDVAEKRCVERRDKGGHDFKPEILRAGHKGTVRFINEVQRYNIPIYNVECQINEKPKISEFKVADINLGLAR